MIGRPGRGPAWTVVVALVAALALALSTPAAAESTAPGAGATTPGEGAVLEPVPTSPAEALAYWTPARLASAEPLSVLTVPGAPSISTSTAIRRSTTGTRTAAPEGIEVVAAESTMFPNRAIGKVFGMYEVNHQAQGFECSGSVINSPRGNVVLTAGHCAIDPETGATAGYLIFIPGYREGSWPYGAWIASEIATTKSWKKTAKAGWYPNEGADLALLVMSRNVQETVGALGIAFDQPCNQLYTQYGYPANPPYEEGKFLYSHTAPYAGVDTNPNFSPTPMKIVSDFTQGASGGPWTVGPSSAPTVLSVTAYGYEQQPGYLYGPYFGEEARAAYEKVLGRTVPPGIEETCKALPEAASSTEPGPGTASPPPDPAPPRVSLKVKKVHRRANGSAVVVARVSGAGLLKLAGVAVRAASLKAPAAGNYRLKVAPKKQAGRTLRRRGRATVRVKIAFSASGRTKRVSKLIHLSRRAGDRPARRQTSRSG